MLVPSTASWHRIPALDPGARPDSSTDPTAILDPRVGCITGSQGRTPVHYWVPRWDPSTILDPRLASRCTTGSQYKVPVHYGVPGQDPRAKLDPRVGSQCTTGAQSGVPSALLGPSPVPGGLTLCCLCSGGVTWAPPQARPGVAGSVPDCPFHPTARRWIRL